MEEDLKNKTRDELLELAKKVHVEKPHEMSTEKLRHEVYENTRILQNIREKNEHYRNLPAEDFKNLLDEYQIEYSESDLTDRNNIIFSLDSAIERKKMQDKFDSAFNYKVEEDTDIDLHKAAYNLKKLKSIPNTEDVNSDAFRQEENLKIGYENVIRKKFGLKEKELNHTDADLEIILMLDNMEIGETCHEFLETIESKNLQEKYKYRFEDLIRDYNWKVAGEQRAKEEEYTITMEFQQFKNVPKKLVYVNGVPEVNPSYLLFQEAVKKLYRKLTNKIKGYGAGSQKVPQYLSEIYGEVEKLHKKHIN